MKLARTIHLDESDKNVFPNPACSGEWAIAGTFTFIDANINAFTRKELLAFKEGWLGITSFGYSTLVQVDTIKDNEFEVVSRQLATHIFEKFNAPGMLAALDAAKNEIKDMEIICQHPEGTLLSIGREITEKEIREKVRVIQPASSVSHAKIWTIENNE